MITMRKAQPLDGYGCNFCRHTGREDLNVIGSSDPHRNLVVQICDGCLATLADQYITSLIPIKKPFRRIAPQPLESLKRCPAKHGKNRARCGLWDHHDGDHTLLIPTGVPWDPAKK